MFDSIEHPYQVVIKVSHWLLSIVNFQMFFTSNAKKGLTLFAKLIKGRPDNLFLSSTDLFPTCLSSRKTCKAKLSPNWKSVQLEICTYLNWVIWIVHWQTLISYSLTVVAAKRCGEAGASMDYDKVASKKRQGLIWLWMICLFLCVCVSVCQYVCLRVRIL